MAVDYDVISIGGATRDIFFKTSRARLIPDPGARKGQLIAFEYGAKMIPEEVYLTNGGGGHNSASCFARLGLTNAAVLSVGNDGSGHRIEKRLARRGVDTRFIRFDNDFATAISMIVVYERDHISFLYRGANDQMAIDDWTGLESAEWLYLTSLTGQGASLLPAIASFVRERGMRLAFNPGSHQLNQGYEGLKEVLAATEVLLLNHEEALRLASSTGPQPEPEDREALLEVLFRMGPKKIVVTEGQQGSCAVDASGIYSHPAVEVPVLDTTGAGDSYGSTLVSFLIREHDLRTAMCAAAINSAAVVTHLGATEGLLDLAGLRKRAVACGAA
ncbi:MAG: carbohydrate kinase family protein [Candidatus Aquicultorales bacterium]